MCVVSFVCPVYRTISSGYEVPILAPVTSVNRNWELSKSNSFNNVQSQTGTFTLNIICVENNEDHIVILL